MRSARDDLPPVEKVFERIDEMVASDGIVVYNYGTLRGEWLDGTPSRHRYIDRFLIRDGRIADQKVWTTSASWRRRARAERRAHAPDIRLTPLTKRCSVDETLPRGIIASISWKRPRVASAFAIASCRPRRVLTRTPSPPGRG